VALQPVEIEELTSEAKIIIRLLKEGTLDRGQAENYRKRYEAIRMLLQDAKKEEGQEERALPAIAAATPDKERPLLDRYPILTLLQTIYQCCAVLVAIIGVGALFASLQGKFSIGIGLAVFVFCLLVCVTNVAAAEFIALARDVEANTRRSALAAEQQQAT
jgi:hypothetical protein